MFFHIEDVLIVGVVDPQLFKEYWHFIEFVYGIIVGNVVLFKLLHKNQNKQTQHCKLTNYDEENKEKHIGIFVK